GPRGSAAHADGRMPAERLRGGLDDAPDPRHGLLEPRLAALPAGLRDGLHLSPAADTDAGDHPAGASRQRHRRLQRGAQRRRERRRRDGHHPARAPQPGAPEHLGRPRGRLEPGHGPPTQGADGALREQGRVLVHGRPAGARDPVVPNERAVASPRLRRRLLAELDRLPRRPPVDPPDAARPRRAERGVIHRGDFKAQARAVFDAIRALVEAGGGTLDSVVKITTYVTHVRYRPDFRTVREEFFGARGPGSTMVEVSALAHPDYLIEVEAIAVI